MLFLLLKYKLKEPPLRNPALKSLGLKKQIWLIIRLLLYLASMKLLSLILKNRKKSIRRRNKIRKILFQPLKIMPLKVIVRRKNAIENITIT